MASARRFQFISDSELVGMAQVGSLEACDELVSRFRQGVVLIARQCLDSPEAAQDVAQETFLLAFRALPQLQDTTKFAGWLHAIARNRARRVSASLRQRQTSDLADWENVLISPPDETGTTPLETLLNKEQQATVRALLSELPPDYQTILHLFYYEQWPASRIAEFLSLPLTTIKWRLRYGRQQLHRRLAALLDEDETHTTDTRQDKQEKNHGRTRSTERDTADADAAGKDGRDGRACGADGQLRERRSQFGETLQHDCGASGRPGRSARGCVS